MSGQLTMYTTTWCGFCRNLKKPARQGRHRDSEVDIERDPAAAEFVMSVNGGNQTVPTVVFPDGTAMVNPSAAQVRERLAAVSAGQEVQARTDTTRRSGIKDLCRTGMVRADRDMDGEDAGEREHAAPRG